MAQRARAGDDPLDIAAVAVTGEVDRQLALEARWAATLGERGLRDLRRLLERIQPV